LSFAVFIAPVEEASRRLRADHDLLLAKVNSLTGEQLAAPYQVASGLHRLRTAPLASLPTSQEGADRP
jgi:hypothetical protein